MLGLSCGLQDLRGGTRALGPRGRRNPRALHWQCASTQVEHRRRPSPSATLTQHRPPELDPATETQGRPGRHALCLRSLGTAMVFFSRSKLQWTHSGVKRNRRVNSHKADKNWDFPRRRIEKRTRTLLLSGGQQCGASMRRRSLLSAFPHV